MVYCNIISCCFTISCYNYCSCLCCIYIWTSWYRYIYCSVVFFNRCICWIISYTKVRCNIFPICWPLHKLSTYSSASWRTVRYSSCRPNGCSSSCTSNSRSVSSYCLVSKIRIIKITSTIYNFCYILFPLLMKTFITRVCMISMFFSICIYSIPWISIYNKLNNIKSIIMSPFITTCIRLTFYISNNTLNNTSIFLIEINVISNLSICRCTCNYISTIYSSEPFFIKIHTCLLLQFPLIWTWICNSLPIHICKLWA